jgi:hypothetical protein
MLFSAGILTAEVVDVSQANRVTVVSISPDGKISHSGLGFLFNSRTLICSYSDVKGESQIRVDFNETKAYTNRLIAWNEGMDLAVLHIAEELPAEMSLGNSNTLAIGDPVSFWLEAKRDWVLSSGTVRTISDTGKGYNLISVDTASPANHSVPLYNSRMQIVGWLRGKNAVPLEMIAQLAEKQNENVTILEARSSQTGWKFQKPGSSGALTFPEVAEMITLHGPASYPFRIDLPQAWKARAYEPLHRFLLHSEDSKSGICAELRVMHSGRDLLGGIDQIETIVFAGLLRSELIPYSTNHFTGFRAQYEDTDSSNAYGLDVFYTSFSGNLYILSVSYPQSYQDQIGALNEQIFSSFRK